MSRVSSYIRKTWRRIGTRLFVAFGIVASTTVLSALVAWLAVERLSGDLSSLTNIQLPTASAAARIAEVGGNIRAEMPKLLTVSSEKDRIKTRNTIQRDIIRLRELLQLKTQYIDLQSRQSLLSLLSEITENIRQVNNNVDQRFKLRSRNERLIERLRWSHADFLDEIDPIVADASFNMTSALGRLKTPKSKHDLRAERETIKTIADMREALMRINAASNLSVGLIMRGSVQDSAHDIEGTRQFLSEVTDSIEATIPLIEHDASNISLLQSISQILDFTNGENDVLGLRKTELLFEEKGRELLAQNRGLFLRLETMVSARISEAEQVARQSILDAEKRVSQERFVLIVASSVSIAIFLFVGWGYVGKRIVSRLNEMRSNMDDIASGDLDVDVKVSGHDEITEMARTLLVFRDTAKEAILAQEELVQAAKLAALGQMSAGIAHETNQTLAAITYNAHNARTLVKRNQIQEAELFIEKIGHIAAKMGKTVNHLKVFARRPSDEIRPVDIGEVIRNALFLFDERISKSKIRVDFTQVDDHLRVMGEAIRLEQVFVNIIANALDAMSDGSEHILRITSYPHKNKGVVEIEDNGPGIRPDILSNIFDPFFTTKDTGSGLGLGLSISQKIIRDFGGMIEVKSKETIGSTFKVILNRQLHT